MGCIHTHPGESSLLSDDDYSLLQNFKLDYVCALAGKISNLEASVAFLENPEEADSSFIEFLSLGKKNF
jgi:proteasome lid subunit RPN8/RPN11